MMFITPEELAELTGYRRNADQRRWLKSHGWKFEVFCRSIFRSNLDAFHHLNACRQVGSAARAG